MATSINKTTNITMDDIRDLISYLVKMDPYAIDKGGYSISGDSAVALMMLVLSGLDSFSSGSLEVPTLVGLGQLDHTGGSLYVGAQIPLVTLSLLANGYIALRQLLDERKSIDSKKIYPEKERILEIKRAMLAQWQEVLAKSGAEDDKFVASFIDAYQFALHKQIIANMDQSSPMLLHKWTGDETFFHGFNDIHDELGNQYQTLSNLLKLDLYSNDPAEIVNHIMTLKYVPEESLLALVPEESLLAPVPEESVLAPVPEESVLAPVPEKSVLALVPKESLLAPVLQTFGPITGGCQFQISRKNHPVKVYDELIFYSALKDLDGMSMDPKNKDALIEAWAKSRGFLAQKIDQSKNGITSYKYHYLTDQWSYNSLKALGRIIGSINVLVNIGVGVGAFIGICAVMYALTGLSMVALVGGWPLLILMAAFALLAAVGAYFITRSYIINVFDRIAYEWQAFWHEKDKWAYFKAALNNKNVLTALITLPTSIGITIIETAAFMISMPAAPWVLPVAIFIGLFTFIACVSLFGSMFYDTYPRLKNMLTDFKHFKQKVLPALLVTLMVMTAMIVAVCLTCNPIMAFLAIAPVSAVCLLLIIAAVVMMVTLGFHQGWSMKKTNLTTLGLIAVVSQVLAILCSAFMFFGLGPAIAIAALSIPMFFSWAVLTVASPDQVNHQEIAAQWLGEHRTSCLDQSARSESMDPTDDSSSEEVQLLSPKTRHPSIFGHDGDVGVDNEKKERRNSI